MSVNTLNVNLSNVTKSGFYNRVEAIVRQIPAGRLMTYGQLAALAGSPAAARVVGGIAHFGDPNLPWQRVVNKQGGLAKGYPGGLVGHRAALELEAIPVTDNYYVNIRMFIWWPLDYALPFSGMQDDVLQSMQLELP